ncbi:unnamed protein product [Mesocestoides corti]|uniref:Uncharacterized protein n=1 Tax=Mesocestoides corti TaxID=53468 RepID=A0A0R3UC39_MESCO|nr:unnamed protein product [Mesocestoides corti]
MCAGGVSAFVVFYQQQFTCSTAVRVVCEERGWGGILLLGDAFVGKTSLLIRFKDKAFLKGSYISTVGIDYKTKLVNCDGKLVKLQLWDTAGQERFRSLTKSYYRDADGKSLATVMLVYDVTKLESFINIKSWLHDLATHAPSSTVVAIVGNKMDESAKRVVKCQTGAALAATTNALTPPAHMPPLM